MVSMQDAEKIAEDFIKKKTGSEKVDILSANPLKAESTWIVKGVYTVSINDHKMTFDFDVVMNTAGKITSYNLNR